MTQSDPRLCRIWRLTNQESAESLLLMVQKSGGRAPVELGSLSHCLQGLIHPRWLFGISEPSTVMIRFLLIDT